MKYKNLFIPTAILAAVSFTACQTKEKLAQKVEGSWSGIPERVDVSDAVSADVTKTFEFLPDSNDKADGTVIVTAMVSITKALPQSDSIVAPLTLTGAGIASMTGTYEAFSFDKIALKLNPSTFQLSIDPEAVNYQYDALTGEGAPDLSQLTPVWSETLRTELTPVVKANFAAMDTLVDVKVKDGMFHCRDLRGTDLTLHIQNAENAAAAE